MQKAYEMIMEKKLDKRNFRNLVDMSHQRKCTRAYWEYRQLFNDYEQALRNYSEEWNTLCKDTCKGVNINDKRSDIRLWYYRIWSK